MRRITLLLFAAVLGCGTRPVVVQTGAPSAPPPASPVAREESSPSDTIRPLGTLSRGWNRIPGRSGTGCAHDSTFAFRVRPALPDKVLIFLNGGGVCWRVQDCDPKGKPTYTMTVDSANDASVRQGIFDVANPANPLRDFTLVFVPSCTGDVHLGTREVDYEARDAKGMTRIVAVRHGGAANLESALDWVYTNVRAPRVVVVAGISTGAIPTPVVAEKVARKYPRARVVQLGDAAGGYRSDAVPGILASWGASEYLGEDPAYRSLDSADFSFQRLYTSAARAAPRVRFAQFNTIEDATQLSFLAMLGVKGTPLVRLLAQNLDDIHDRVPSFRTYTAPGRSHTILKSNAMYSLTVGGVLFRDWLEALVNGEVVEDVGSSLLAAAPPKAKPKP